jgi:hypothetical protein
MKITREQLKKIVGEVLEEEKDYQSYFQAMLKKHGVSSPDEFKSDDEKKAFFNKVDSNWNEVSEKIKSWKEAELTANQQKLDVDNDGKIEGDDLAKVRAGQTAEGEEEQLPQTKILSKENETLVKSGKGNMYNITKVNESSNKNGKVHFEKKLKDGNIFQVIDRDTTGMRGSQDDFLMQIVDKHGKVVKPIGSHPSLDGAKKYSNKFESVIKEGRYDADLDKIEAAVKNASSFMNVGTELKKIGVKYDFSTSMIPMYMIKVSGNTIAICNKKYAAGAEREVKDIAIGLLN